MEVWLVDINPELVSAWKKYFKDFKNVHIECEDILKIAENTIVSPANSYGYMDGGIDLMYTHFFGLRPQQEIQRLIGFRREGYLPVGAAVLVKTGDDRIPYMISAPTMISPGPVADCNAFFATAAALQVAHKNQNLVKKLFCPGMATGVGRVSPENAAKEMALAYRKYLKAC
ncbi:MAG: AraC family transcriptional regulator [bacterium]|nr:AraC family transcriptional regulator [bacterium]